MEQVIDWLNENENRAFPLLESAPKHATIDGITWEIPDNMILDLQLVTDKDLNNLVQLDHIKTHDNGNVHIVFTVGDSVELAKFVLENVENASYPLYVRHEDGHLIVLGEGIREIPSLQHYKTLVCNIPVEPGVCYQFNNAWLGVSSIQCTNEKATNEEGYAPALPLVSQTTPGLIGDVKLFEGYNFRVAITDNLIDLEVNSSYGLKMDCTTSFIPEYCKDCDQIVSYINGIPPDASGNFRLLAGTNVNITPGNSVEDFDDIYDNFSAKDHSLFVGLTFQATDLCAPVNIKPTI